MAIKKKISNLDPNRPRWQMAGTLANMDYIFGDPEKRTPEQKIAWAKMKLQQKEREAIQHKQTSVTEVIREETVKHPEKSTQEQKTALVILDVRQKETVARSPKQTSVTEGIREETVK